MYFFMTSFCYNFKYFYCCKISVWLKITNLFYYKSIYYFICHTCQELNENEAPESIDEKVLNSVCIISLLLENG